MNLTSYQFLYIIFPISFIACIFCKKTRYIALAIISLFIYVFFQKKRIVVLAFSILVSFFAGIVIDKSENGKRKLFTTLAVLCNFSVLFLFKYSSWIISIFQRTFNYFSIDIILPTFNHASPIGISFFTFTTTAYLFDIYRKKIAAEKNIIKYFSFVAFYPCIIAGPIQRADEILNQFNNPVKLTYERLKKGFLLFLCGVALKLILSDRLGIFVNNVYSKIGEAYGFTVLIAAFFYSIQIYADFLGYSLTAIGLACALGFDLKPNFKTPYLSTSIKDFWRNWHISLTSYLTDYIYKPLGGSRYGTVRKYINIITVFLISGLWHGAGIKFIIWGLLHAFYQIFGALSKNTREKICKEFYINRNTFSFKLYQCIFIFLITTFAWIFFRSDSTRHALLIIKSIANLSNPWILFDGTLFQFGLTSLDFNIILLFVIVFMTVSILQKKNILSFQWFSNQNAVFQGTVFIILLDSCIVLGLYGTGYNSENFIYAGF